MAKEYLIGDFLKRIKRPIKLIDDQEYKLVTIKMNHNGVVLREHKKGALIKSNMYEVKKGDFILSGIDARNGAFGIVPPEIDGAIVTNDFWYFEIDENIISKRLFLELTATTWFDEICKRGSDGTTQRIRLQKNKFFNQSILLPEGNEQKELLDKILSFKSGQSELDSEIQTQKQLLTQLKQSILQEAIQGKLTADWRAQNPGTEPASELLNRIKAEKAQLIKAKKIKKEKALQPITKVEIPFELPEGWVWCRLGDFAIVKGGKRVSNGYKLLQSPTKHIYIRVTDMKNGTISKENIQYIDEKMFEKIKNYTISKNDLYITIAGTIGQVGEVPELFHNMNLTENAAKFVFNNDKINKQWLKTCLTSKHCQVQFSNNTKTKTAQPKLALSRITPALIPLPPYEEQKAIVEKVESLIQKCQALEQEIKTSEANAQMLMQAVLKEAFEGKQEEYAK